MKDCLKILFIGNNPHDVNLLQSVLKKSGFNFGLKVAETQKEFIYALDNYRPDVLISDDAVPEFNSTEALKIFKSKNLNIPFILFTGNASVAFAVDMIKSGADDYILKSDLKRLPGAITDSLKSKDALQKSIDSEKKPDKNEMPFRSLVENVGDMICVLNNELIFTYTNPVITKVLGYDRENIVGKSFSDLLIENINLTALFRNETVLAELKVKHYDCSMRIMECVIKNYTDAQGNSSFIINARDITERKRIEQKLKTKVSELDTFIYRSSHDMKGPVCTLQGLLNIAHEEVRDAKALEYLKLIDQNNKKLDAILTSLIEITHITRKNTEKQIIRLDEFFRNLVTTFNGTMKLVDFHSEINVAKEFSADPRLLQNIFHNLLDNSIRYRKPGQIKSEVELKVFQHNGHTIFQLKDHGVGIPDDQQEKVFNLFYKANVNSSGSGLGLYIVKESVDKMNGMMEMESRQGEGTAVTVVIPNK